MSATGFILRVLIAVTLFVGVNAAINDAYVEGYEKRLAEEKASREYVFDKMKEMNFCRWLAITRFDEDCRSERLPPPMMHRR